MYHSVPLAWMAEMQRERIRAEMASGRPMKGGLKGTPGFRERLALGLGAALIAAGRRLQDPYLSPYDPSLAQNAKASRSGC